MRVLTISSSPTMVPANGVWYATLAIILINTIWFAASDFTFEPKSLLGMLAVAVIVFLVATIYTRWRPDPRVAAATGVTGFLIIFNAAAALFSYLITSINLPLVDHLYAGFDASVGFSWTVWLHQVNAMPTFGWVLEMAYRTSLPQVLFAVLCLSVLGRLRNLSEFIDVYVWSLIVIIIISGLFPSSGAFSHYAVPTDDYANLTPFGGLVHMDHYFGLRDGSLRTITMANIQGLITFPSFHTTLAIITAWALRDVRFINIIAIALNGMVILSTPTHGGHYLADVVGGAAVAVAVIWGRAWVMSLRASPAPNPQPV